MNRCVAIIRLVASHILYEYERDSTIDTGHGSARQLSSADDNDANHQLTI